MISIPAKMILRLFHLLTNPTAPVNPPLNKRCVDILEREDGKRDEQGGEGEDGQVEVEAGQDPLVHIRVVSGVLQHKDC